MSRILLVDDDRLLLRATQKLLATDGHFCRLASSAAEARAAVAEARVEEPFELAVLDVGLPDQDGFSLCRQLRAQHKMPIMLLTARSDSADRVVGLEIGADDYVTKPFDPKELLARVRALLRRSQEYGASPSRRIELGAVTLDVDAREAYREGKPVGLTEREFELLHFMARHLGKALASDWLFESVWGYEADCGLKALTVCVRRVRQKIEPDSQNPRMLLTLRNFGYRLVSA